jgi:hypothetical protein
LWGAVRETNAGVEMAIPLRCDFDNKPKQEICRGAFSLVTKVSDDDFTQDGEFALRRPIK